jgi:hypothetical protein
MRAEGEGVQKMMNIVCSLFVFFWRFCGFLFMKGCYTIFLLLFFFYIPLICFGCFVGVFSGRFCVFVVFALGLMDGWMGEG